jgi:chromosome condensin MukBEF MukE localization factor
MFVHKTLPYFGASPDALVGNEGIVEIKCPFSGKHLSSVEAVRKKFIKFCNVDNNNQLCTYMISIYLKKNHPYHYQIQGQLEVTDRKYCISIVWTPHGFSFLLRVR